MAKTEEASGGGPGEFENPSHYSLSLSISTITGVVQEMI